MLFCEGILILGKIAKSWNTKYITNNNLNSNEKNYEIQNSTMLVEMCD